jgi:transposase
MERERRYPSDLTDEQWEIVEPMLPLIKSPGRIPKHPRRAMVDAILYVVRSGCSWRQLPIDFPPWQTVYWQFQQWEKRQVTERIVEELREQLRLEQGREAEPSAGVMDSQSVKAADTVGRDTRGYDAGKKINGRKRFIVTDTLGLLVVVCVMSASRQDRDGAKTTLLSTYLFSPIRHVFADQGFAGRLVDWAALRIRRLGVRVPSGAQDLDGSELRKRGSGPSCCLAFVEVGWRVGGSLVSSLSVTQRVAAVT